MRSPHPAIEQNGLPEEGRPGGAEGESMHDTENDGDAFLRGTSLESEQPHATEPPPARCNGNLFSFRDGWIKCWIKRHEATHVSDTMELIERMAALIQRRK
jgi:hypothetical protein